MIYRYDPAQFEPVKQVALQFPGAEESTSHENTPSVKVRNKLMTRMHESGAFIPIHLDFHLVDQYLESHPELFHVPDHFRGYKYICMWVHNYDSRLLREILEHSWRGLASQKMLKEWDAAK
ncbi:MAG: hypothetical protein EOO05_10525 [Chitinophagaceae bacterium]|nr:MAG: hypothetical protein EOO05_10525 [Chitinophagaceae bacterium]